MANTLVFNRHRPPILPIELMDEQNTVIHVTPPTVDLQEELRARLTDLTSLFNGDDEDEKRAALFDLAARLMSCNRNMRKITAEQLCTVYRVDEEDLVVFYHAYADFLKEIENAKN